LQGFPCFCVSAHRFGAARGLQNVGRPLLQASVAHACIAHWARCAACCWAHASLTHPVAGDAEPPEQPDEPGSVPEARPDATPIGELIRDWLATELTPGAEALICGSLLVGIRWLTEPKTLAERPDAEPSPWRRGESAATLKRVRPPVGETGRPATHTGSRKPAPGRPRTLRILVSRDAARLARPGLRWDAVSRVRAIH
jgi:hypothetical protein